MQPMQGMQGMQGMMHHGQPVAHTGLLHQGAPHLLPYQGHQGMPGGMAAYGAPQYPAMAAPQMGAMAPAQMVPPGFAPMSAAQVRTGAKGRSAKERPAGGGLAHTPLTQGSRASAGWSIRTRPFWPFSSMNCVQSPPLHVLIVLLAELPLHIPQAMGTPVWVASRPQKAMYSWVDAAKRASPQVSCGRGFGELDDRLSRWFRGGPQSEWAPELRL